MKRTEERFCEPEDRTREISNMNDREKPKKKGKWPEPQGPVRL